MAKQRGTPRRAKKKPAAAPRRRTTALVQIQPAPAVPVVQAQPVEDTRRITEGVMLGELGLVEIKFTPREEAILSEPVEPSRVRVKPNGSVYLPHADYTRWFNRAFGRGGWNMVPVGIAGLANGVVVCPYVMYIHRQPAAFAMGEQEWFQGNRNQSYGDALEATIASALRRCAKRLGVGLELWDRDWGWQWMRQFAMPVKVKQKNRDGQFRVVTQYRLPSDPPLPYELGQGEWEGVDQGEEDFGAPGGSHEAERPSSRRSHQAPADREVGHHAQSGEPISKPQRQRLVMIIKNSGRDEEAVIAWLRRAYGIETTAAIKRSDYDRVCQLIEGQGSLPEPRRR